MSAKTYSAIALALSVAAELSAQSQTVSPVRESLSLTLPLPLVPGKQQYPLFALVSLVFFVCFAFLALARPDDAQVRLIGACLMRPRSRFCTRRQVPSDSFSLDGRTPSSRP
jgi:hypothetical protein